MPLYYVVVALPFFCAGLALALLFTRGSAVVNRLYAFDLLGAGLGCGAIALVMPVFGGSGSVVIASALGLVAAVIIGWQQARRLAVVSAGLAAGAVLLTFFAGSVLPISITPNKRSHSDTLSYSAWNTILALMLAMMVGFFVVLILAGVCYVAAWLALAGMRRSSAWSG